MAACFAPAPACWSPLLPVPVKLLGPSGRTFCGARRTHTVFSELLGAPLAALLGLTPRLVHDLELQKV